MTQRKSSAEWARGAKNQLATVAVLLLLAAHAPSQAVQFTVLRTLKVDPKGSAGTVEACEFSPDGSLIAAGNAQGECRIYETSTGKLIRTITHSPKTDADKSGEVETVYWSPDGKLLSTTGNGTGIRIWNVATGELAATLSTKGTSDGAAWSPDGKWHVNQGGIYEVGSWKQVKGLGHTCDVNSVDFSGDSKYMVTGSCDHTAKVWRVSDWSVLHTLKAGSSVKSARLSPDLKYIATGCSAPKVFGVKVWNFSDGKEVAYLPNPLIEGTGTGSEAVAFAPNSAYLLNGASRNGVTVYDTKTWQKVLKAPGLARCEYVDVHKELAIGGGEEGIVVVWKMADMGTKPTSGIGGAISTKHISLSGAYMFHDALGRSERPVGGSRAAPHPWFPREEKP